MGRLKARKSLENAARTKDSSLPFSTRGMDKQPAPADSRGIVIPERAIEKIKAQYPSGVSFVHFL